jgi:hypothetical protein
MWIMFILAFTAFATVVLLITLPAMFIHALIAMKQKHDSTPLQRALIITGGLIAGMVITWTCIVLNGWAMSFRETIYAMVHSDIYGNKVEDYAEGAFFLTLFFGNIGALAAGIIGWFATRHAKNSAALVN